MAPFLTGNVAAALFFDVLARLPSFIGSSALSLDALAPLEGLPDSLFFDFLSSFWDLIFLLKGLLFPL